MKLIITENQLDRVIKKYFDSVFDQAVFKDYDVGGSWEGFIILDNSPDGFTTLVGRPIGDDFWFSNGQFFNGWWEMFNMVPEDFNEKLSKYIKERYNIDMGKIL